MRIAAVVFGVSLVVAGPALAADNKASSPPTLDAINAARFDPGVPPPDNKSSKTPVDPVLLKAQVLLDRAHTSPGTIDGRSGANYAHALAAFAASHHLSASPSLTAEIWSALGDDPNHPVFVKYTVTAADAAGPFTPDIPTDYGKLAKLKALDHRNATEALAERFHMDERLLTALNPDAGEIKEGTVLLVADVTRPPVTDKLDHIDVDKAKGQVRGLDAQGNIVVAYPATIGSTDLPSPTGTHAVKGVAWHPVYNYDPVKNFKQGHNDHKLIIPRGPNNPVGTVFIALDKPTYGLHGTPDPSTIDKTHSHGCVRMTNWDALQLAAAVRPGVKVSFLNARG